MTLPGMTRAGSSSCRASLASSSARAMGCGCSTTPASPRRDVLGGSGPAVLGHPGPHRQLPGRRLPQLRHGARPHAGGPLALRHGAVVRARGGASTPSRGDLGGPGLRHQAAVVRIPVNPNTYRSDSTETPDRLQPKRTVGFVRNPQLGAEMLKRADSVGHLPYQVRRKPRALSPWRKYR